MDAVTGKVAIVIGASGGIGRSIAQRLAADGFRVVVNYAGSAGKAEETIAAIQSEGGEAIAVQGDVSKPEDVAKLFDAAKEAFGRVDVAVNSAGVMLLSPIAQAKLDEFDRTIAINLRGARS